MDIAKAIELFEKSASVGILLPPDPDSDALAAVEVLARVLDAEGKQVGFLTRPEEDALAADAPLERIRGFNPLPREFIVSVNARDFPVSRVSYEKLDDRVDIVLSPASPEFSAEALSFRTGKTNCELLCAVAVPDIDEIPQPPGTEPDFFTQTPIVVFGSEGHHKPFGEANLVAPAPGSLCQTVFSLLTQWQKRLPKPAEECATLLLSGIIRATDGFQRDGVPAETLMCAAELMRSGADLVRARAIALPPQPISFTQLAGRASVRSKIQQDRAVLWSYLTAEDFEKTSRSVSDAAGVLLSLRRAFPHPRCIILLWQDPADRAIRAIAHTNVSLLRTLGLRVGAEPSGAALSFPTFWQNFQDAEQAIANLLDESANGK